MKDNVTPMPAPQAPKTKEVRYDFTESQLETMKPLQDQMAQIQTTLNFFLNHIVREAKLPQSAGGYNLALDQQTGKPYLIGQVPVEAQKEKK